MKKLIKPTLGAIIPLVRSVALWMFTIWYIFAYKSDGFDPLVSLELLIPVVILLAAHVVVLHFGRKMHLLDDFAFFASLFTDTCWCVTYAVFAASSIDGMEWLLPAESIVIALSFAAAYVILLCINKDLRAIFHRLKVRHYADLVIHGGLLCMSTLHEDYRAAIALTAIGTVLFAVIKSEERPRDYLGACFGVLCFFAPIHVGMSASGNITLMVLWGLIIAEYALECILSAVRRRKRIEITRQIKETYPNA